MIKPTKERIKSHLSVFAFVISVGVFGGWAQAATYYMPDDFPNLRTAFAEMNAGDELIIRDGTYTGSDNMISSTNAPPAGTPSKWTIIRAEHPGKVYFGNPNVNTSYFDIELGIGNLYAEFHGIIWLGGGLMNYGTRYVKFIQCGNGNNLVNTGNSAEFCIFYTSYVLCEDCFAWGGRRYAFLAYRSDHIIFRRCVGRVDAVNTLHGGGKTEPIGGISIYWSSYCEVQNCLIIDSDTKDYWTYESLVGAFCEPNGETGGNNFFRGCIGLNLDMPLHVQRSTYRNSHRINMIGWDIPTGSLLRGETYISHATIGKIHSALADDATIDSYEGWTSVKDSLFVNITAGKSVLADVESSDYNCFYNTLVPNYQNTQVGTHDITNINPFTNSLKYLPSIEPNSELTGKASDGGDIGATVMRRIGVSGTLWGEGGYNEITNEPLWPFPNEDLIKRQMSQYSYDADGDGNPEITGKRGFCADGTGLYGGPITLTSYIWEYLGNPCPADICNYETTDTTPPTRTNPQPTGTLSSGTTQTTISLTTDETATCKYSTTAGTDYDSMENTFSSTNSTTHSQIVTGLSDGNTYHYYIRCQDEQGNTNTDDYPITFSVAETSLQGDVTADNIVDINDVQACVNHILGRQNWGSAADVNGDEEVNVLDVQEIVNIVLG